MQRETHAGWPESYFERDERLKENVLKALENKDRKEGSRHDPRKTGVEVEVTSEGESV